MSVLMANICVNMSALGTPIFYGNQLFQLVQDFLGHSASNRRIMNHRLVSMQQHAKYLQICKSVFGDVTGYL